VTAPPEPSPVRRERAHHGLVAIGPLEQPRIEIGELGAQEAIAREAQPVDRLRGGLTGTDLREVVRDAAERHVQLDHLVAADLDAPRPQELLGLGQRERIDPDPLGDPVVEAAALAHDLLEHPRRRRSADHDDEPRLLDRPAVPEVLERGEEPRAAGGEPRDLVEEHDLLRPPAPEPRGHEAPQLLERALPVRGRRGKPERARERAQLPRQIDVVHADVLEADRAPVDLADQERLADPAAAVDRDELGLRGPQRVEEREPLRAATDERHGYI
jgi:hypothetical protein